MPYEWVHRRQRMLESGECTSITELAAPRRSTGPYLCRVLRLTLLAPEMVEAILDARQLAELQPDDLLVRLPINWERQRFHFG